MMNDAAQKYLEEILQKVQQGNVVFFLGAGASHAAGGPTGKKLTEMIKERFPKINWASIFTTNFDDLIELAYRISPHVFKIMGSMTALEGETGSMVLSRADYHQSLIRRRKYLELLSDFIKTGTMIFVGYSFRDRSSSNYRRKNSTVFL